MLQQLFCNSLELVSTSCVRYAKAEIPFRRCSIALRENSLLQTRRSWTGSSLFKNRLKYKPDQKVLFVLKTWKKSFHNEPIKWSAVPWLHLLEVWYILGVRRITEVTIREQMIRMTSRAIAIPFQFLWGGALPTRSWKTN